MRKTHTAALLSLLSLALGAVACSSTPGDDSASVDDELSVNAKVFGLGVDAPVAVSSPLFAELKAGWKAKEGFSLQSARRVFPIDSVDDQGHPTYAADRAALETWAAAVQSGGLTPIVAIGVGHPGGMDHATFRQRFRDLLDKLPAVQAWGLVNEPNLAPYDVDTAVAYVEDGQHVLAEAQKQGVAKGVHLFVGEFAFQDSNPGQLAGMKDYWAKYGDRVLSEVHAGHLLHFPHLWGFHPYWDTTRGDTIGTDAFDAFLAGLEKKAGLGDRALRVWLTETGTMMEWGGGQCADSGNADAQYHGARAVYAFAARPRVDRVYWWQFEQAERCWGGSWDSGMVDWSGAPRQAFCALANLPRSACTGSDVSRDCGGPGNWQLAAGRTLGPKESITSCDGKYAFVVQGTDGNVVEYEGATPLWASNTEGHPGDRIAMQTDGNLVIYAGSRPLWASHTNGHPGARLVLQLDGNVVIYEGSKPLWARFGL